MFKVKIANEGFYEADYEVLEHDLLTQKGLTGINDFIYSLKDNDYTIIDIQTEHDWGVFDNHTLVNDLCNTALLIKEMNDFQYELFLKLVKTYIYEPEDVARNVLHNKISLVNEVLEDDIWEVVDYEDKMYAILY